MILSWLQLLSVQFDLFYSVSFCFLLGWSGQKELRTAALMYLPNYWPLQRMQPKEDRMGTLPWSSIGPDKSSCQIGKSVFGNTGCTTMP